MNKPVSGWSSRFLGFRTVASATALLLIAAIAICAQGPGKVPPGRATSASHGKVVGVEFVGRMVADLDKSVAFYKAIGFIPVE